MYEDAHLSNLQISPSILVFINANGQRLRIYLLEAHVKYDVEYITSRLKKQEKQSRLKLWGSNTRVPCEKN